MTRLASLVWLGVLVATLPAAGARAQPLDRETTERAQRHFEAGTQAFDTGDYELAVSEFQRAHELTRHPDLLFNVYSAAERAGQLEEAERALAAYLEQAELEPGRRPVLVQRLERLRARIASDDEAPPLDETPPLDEAPTEGAPPTADEAAPAEPDVTAAEAHPTTDGGGVHPAGVGLLIGAGVLLASFGVFAALSEVEDGNLASSCGRDAGRTCTSDDVGTLEAFNVVADVSWIAAAVVGAVGVVLLLTLPVEGSSAVAVAPWATEHAAGLAAAGRF